MKMMLIFQALLVLLVFYIFCSLFMYFRQDAFIFYPTVARHEGHGYERVSDYRLHRGSISLGGWLVNPELVRQKLLIYYGGNSEDVFLNIEEYRDIQAATLFVAYRGYGPSGGKPGEAELFADALAVIDDMVAKYTPRQIFLVGRSLGTGVACYVAAHRPVQGAILVTPYDSIENVAKSQFPWMPVGLALKHRFDSLAFSARISSPLLVIYGGRDQVISPVRTENLLRHITGEKEVLFIEAADHGTIEMFPEYWQVFLRFINRAGSMLERADHGEESRF